MDLATFFTTQIQGNPAQGARGTGQVNSALGAALNGVDAANAQNGFFEQILAGLAGELEPQDQPSTNDTALTSDSALLAENPRLNLASLLASNSDVQKRIDANIERIDLGPGVEIQQALALNQQVFDETLMPISGDSVRDGLSIPDAVNGDAPPSAAVSAFDDLLTTDIPHELSLGSLLNGLSVGDEDAEISAFFGGELAALSASNLTPAQITRLQELQEQGKDLEEIYAALEASGELQDAIDSLFQSSVSLTPPTAIQAGDKIIIPPQNLPSAAPNPAQEQQQQQMAQLAARLNSLIVGGSADEALVTGDLNSVSDAAKGDFNDKFDAILREFGAKPAHNAPANSAAPAPVNTPAPQTNAAAPALSFFEGEAFTIGGTLFSPASFSSEYSESLGASSVTQSGGYSPAGILTQAPHASQAHPATQLVAATLQKAGANGQDANITLRLTPAELGRVDVRLQFGADKNLKTVIRVENEETLNLLRRDTQILERALQNAGLDVSDGISFELSQDGDFSGNDNERGGGHDNGGTGAGDGSTEEILETTMNWHIDPETGHMRYDLLA